MTNTLLRRFVLARTLSVFGHVRGCTYLCREEWRYWLAAVFFDPDNRLVAASLETEWNSKLHALSEAEQNYERQCQADQLKIGTVQREQVLALATNFPQLWNDPGTADRKRKRMVRLLIEDVTLRKGEQVQLDVRFRGGMSKTLMLPRPLSFCESHKQNPALVAEMDRLLDDYNYADVARILNENGFKTGDGLPLTSTAVGYIRTAYGLKSRFDRLRKRGMLTTVEIARRCGVSSNTISDWRRKGRIRAHAINDRNQFLFEDPGPNPPKKHARNRREDLKIDFGLRAVQVLTTHT